MQLAMAMARGYDSSSKAVTSKTKPQEPTDPRKGPQPDPLRSEKPKTIMFSRNGPAFPQRRIEQILDGIRPESAKVPASHGYTRRGWFLGFFHLAAGLSFSIVKSVAVSSGSVVKPVAVSSSSVMQLVMV